MFSELGVFAKRTIQKSTQFGPFVAEMVDNKAKLSNTKFILTVSSSAILRGHTE